MSGSGPTNRAIAAAIIAVAVVVIGGAVAIGIRLAEDYSGNGAASGPITSLSATPVDRTDRTHARLSTSSTRTTTTAQRRATASCDARSINADLGYPASGSRIIDCGGGWAVMASEQSGDPYWVAFRDGRWRAVRDVSMYQLTCPDEAIAKGAPGWMARKHLNTCSSLKSTTSASRTTARSVRQSSSQRSPRPSVSVTPRPTPSTSSPTSTAVTSSKVVPSVTGATTPNPATPATSATAATPPTT
ncbi:hypothetical protein [Dietzia alimentaria]|uniref:hypothetical protein n=1 Tax=Dietzia alimentaria TaxID=665550 RepID=UPI00029B4F72|nr:hypothetical protein [Dietzia alimentaria]